MSLVVYRYDLRSDYDVASASTTVSMPRNPTPLHVAFQTRAPYSLCVWALINTEEEMGLETFYVIPTGGEVPSGMHEYVGTAQDMAGFVFHVWREV